jgi:two-component system LytT family sensor kinase
MSNIILQQHIDNKLRFYYLRNFRWILHSLYWFFVFVRGQVTVTEKVMSWQGFFLNFLFDNWLIICFYYIYALYLVPQLFKRNKLNAFFKGLAISFALLPALNVIFQIVFEPALPEKYIDHNYTWQEFPRELFMYYRLYFKNFVAFCGFLFLMETAESLSNYKAIASAKKDILQNHKNLLKTQIDPSFVMNALKGMSKLAYKSDEATTGSIIHFSDILRYRLYKSKTERIAFADELQQVKNTFEFYNSVFHKQYVLEVAGGTGKLTVLPSSILGIISKILDKTNENVEDSVIMYMLAMEKEVDMAIEWESPLKEKETILKEIKQHLQDCYDNKSRFELENNGNLLSIRINLKLDTV